MRKHFEDTEAITFWYYIWRKMLCMSKIRRQYKSWERPDSDFIDAGYCLDRYLTKEPK